MRPMLPKPTMPTVWELSSRAPCRPRTPSVEWCAVHLPCRVISASSNMFLQTASMSITVVSATPTALEPPLFAKMTSFCRKPSSTSGPPKLNSS